MTTLMLLQLPYCLKTSQNIVYTLLCPHRMLTVDVNNIMTQLSLLEISQNTIDTIEDDTNTVLDNYNPDCFVLVYAVDDKESFGKKLLLFLFTIVMLDNS